MRSAKSVLRYVAYLAFVTASAIFWGRYFEFLAFRSLSDLSCFESCPPTPLDNWVLAISVLLALPLTVLAFVCFQRIVARLLEAIGESE